MFDEDNLDSGQDTIQSAGEDSGGGFSDWIHRFAKNYLKMKQGGNQQQQSMMKPSINIPQSEPFGGKATPILSAIPPQNQFFAGNMSANSSPDFNSILGILQQMNNSQQG